ncbi:MAG: hypothetical protein PHE78_00850 [Candidatus Gastranaerophilales bacterium]|nr:hypothetical protein [Candidatus Gastranaerophilales bacterium]
MKTKAMIFTTAFLSVLPMKVGEHAKPLVHNPIVKTMQQPSKDIMQHTKVLSLKDSIEAIIEREKQIFESTKALVSKNFDEETAQSLMRCAEEPDDQLFLTAQIAKNNQRQDEKLSAYTLMKLLDRSKKEDQDFALNLITAKQYNNKHYSDEAIDGISGAIRRSSFSYSTKNLVNKMLKDGYPEEGFVKILDELGISKRYVFIPYKEYAQKYEIAQKMTEKTKDGSFIPAEQILKKLSEIEDE